MTLLPSIFPASLAAPRLLSYANGWGNCAGQQPGIPLHKGEMEMEGERRERDRQTERATRQKWADAHQRPKSPSKERFATRAQRAQGLLSTLV